MIRHLAIASALATLAVGIAAPAAAGPASKAAAERRAADYFTAIEAVDTARDKAFLRPIEVRYIGKSAGARIDLLALAEAADASAIRADVIASGATLRRLSFSGSGCWSARYYIDAAPIVLDAIAEVRRDESRILRAAPPAPAALYPELPRACSGDSCLYYPEDASGGGPLEPGRPDSGEDTTEGPQVCFDPSVVENHQGDVTGLPAVLSTSSEIPCSERRRRGVTDDLCRKYDDLAGYHFAWDRVAGNLPSSVPLHCDHKKRTQGGVCDLINAGPNERIGTVRDLRVEPAGGGTDRLVGTVDFKSGQFARQVFRYISAEKYTGCGSVGITYNAPRDLEFYTDRGRRKARVTNVGVKEFSLVQDGQDDAAGILKLERLVAGVYHSASTSRARHARGDGDPFTVGSLSVRARDTAYCKGGVLVDPRKPEAPEGTSRDAGAEPQPPSDLPPASAPSPSPSPSPSPLGGMPR